jgi:hypothetical protein
MFDAKTLSGKNLKGPIVGAVKVNEPFKYNKSFECPAWREEHETERGVHPVYLCRNYHSPHHLYLSAEIAAKVTNDYFPGLWGGVPISREPYQPKHLGEKRTIHHGIEVEDAIQSTGNSPGSKLDWFIHPSWWPVFAEEALAELREDYRRLPEFWQAFESLDASTFVPKLDGRYGFDMEYRSKVGMIAHFGKGLETWARRLEKINWHTQYQPGGAHDSTYQRELFAKNTEWSKAIPIAINT